MTLVLTPEHEALREGVRSFLAARSPESQVRDLMADDSGFDRNAWRVMAKELGLQGLTIPERFGGSGGTAVELGVVQEEMGRALLCAPFFATVVLASTLLVLSQDEKAQQRYLPGIASGESVATLAVAEDSGRWEADGIALAALPAGSGWALTGSKSYVLDGLDADVILAVADTPDGIGVFAVAGDAPGLVRTPLPVLDQTRRLARLEFDGVPADPVGDAAAGRDLARTVRDHAVTQLAMEQVGGAARVLELAVEHAKTRIQFGRAIGSFQAIKHKCADMLVLVEQARALAHHAVEASAAAATAAGGPTASADLRLAAAMAKSYCSEAYTRVADENVQIHGGMGFTWEHPAHLYLKRAKSSELLFGDPAQHRAVVAAELDV